MICWLKGRIKCFSGFLVRQINSRSTEWLHREHLRHVSKCIWLHSAGQHPPSWSAPTTPTFSFAWKPSSGWVPRRMLKAICVTLDVLVSASVPPCVCYRRRQMSSWKHWVLFVVSRASIWRCSLTNVCVSVYVCVCLQSTWGEGESFKGAAVTPYCPPANTAGEVFQLRNH